MSISPEFWLGLRGNDRQLLAEIYNLMYRLSATANYISLSHVSHVVLLFVEQSEWPYPEHYGTNWKILKRMI